MAIFKALYPEEGGAPLGFSCNWTDMGPIPFMCGKVTKTQRGMWAHLSRAHKIKRQPSFDLKSNKGEEATTEVKAVQEASI